MEEVSRRSFLKGSALAAAGAAGAAALAGCANNDAALSETGSTPEWMPETWDYETDVLVIGYGGAGLWAGITAFDEGAQVLYLEKSPFRGGGSSSINMGQWTAPHDADAAAQFAFEAFHGQTPMEVCQAWAEEAVQNPDYADEYGLEYTLGDSPCAEYNIFTGYEEMTSVPATATARASSRPVINIAPTAASSAVRSATTRSSSRTPSP
ncbi:MAG: FAD-binding protein [Adlercreutzia equolifaciens]